MTLFIFLRPCISDNIYVRNHEIMEITKTSLQVLVDEGGSSLDAVIAAIRVLEDHPAFNAGRGAALTMTGHVEMDASIMRGADMSAGAVASVTNLRHPIEAAKAVMERSGHVLLAGDKATQWAVDEGMEPAEEVRTTSSQHLCKNSLLFTTCKKVLDVRSFVA
jgi:isoaspartyl peptidase/L-asparaginase-like protein (Ntn-hydrolase superfamily)